MFYIIIEHLSGNVKTQPLQGATRRVFFIMLSGAGVSALLGLSLAGPIVDRTGVPVWYLLTGIVVIVIGACAFLIPPIMQIERGKPGSHSRRIQPPSNFDRTIQRNTHHNHQDWVMISPPIAVILKAQPVFVLEVNMATLTQAYKPALARIAFIKKRDEFIEKLIPRRCMVVSVGLIFSGMSIPLLMVVQLLPISLLLGFVGFALVATGGVTALIFCGEI